jgi:hypothetical protein
VVGEVVEELFSPYRWWKAQICTRQDGTYRIELANWVDDEGERFWAQISTAGSITDSLEIARGIARDLLDGKREAPYPPEDAASR